MDQADFIKGALIGGCLGGVVALFLAPKSGKDLRHDISEGCNQLNKKSHKYANDFASQAHNVLNSLQGKSHKYADDFASQAHDVLNSLQGMETHGYSPFLAGGAAGAIIGAIAGLLFAPKSGEKLRESFGDEYDHICDKAKSVMDGISRKEHDFEDKLDEWKELFTSIVDKLSSSVSHPKKGHQNNHINKILDWATLGLNLYNKVQARR